MEYKYLLMVTENNNNKYYEGLLQDVRDLKTAYRMAGGAILKR